MPPRVCGIASLGMAGPCGPAIREDLDQATGEIWVKMYFAFAQLVTGLA